MDCDSVELWVRVGEGKSSRRPCSLVGVTRCGSGFEEVVSLCQCPCTPNAFSGLPYPGSPKVTIRSFQKIVYQAGPCLAPPCPEESWSLWLVLIPSQVLEDRPAPPESLRLRDFIGNILDSGSRLRCWLGGGGLSLCSTQCHHLESARLRTGKGQGQGQWQGCS